MTLAIDIEQVTKTFGSGALAFQALRGIDFQVRAGELVMLVGPSGSGKTTLLSILGCVLTATTGRVRLFDTDISRAPDAELTGLRRAAIGFVFQGHNLIASLSARDNIAQGLEIRGVSRRAALAEADALLSRVGLGGREKNRPAQLSGGQRQRVAIARALAGNPPLLLADEPTAALDAESGQTVMELIRELAKERGTTAVVVTHDSRIFSFAERIVHLEDGQISQHQHGHGQ